MVIGVGPGTFLHKKKRVVAYQIAAPDFLAGAAYHFAGGTAAGRVVPGFLAHAIDALAPEQVCRVVGAEPETTRSFHAMEAGRPARPSQSHVWYHSGNSSRASRLFASKVNEEKVQSHPRAAPARSDVLGVLLEMAGFTIGPGEDHALVFPSVHKGLASPRRVRTSRPCSS